MRVIFMGTPDFAVGTLEAIIKAGHEVVGVITQTDKPVGRKQELRPTAVKAAALAHGLDVYQPKKVRNNPEVIAYLEERNPDVIVVAAYGKIIPKEVLEFPKYGCLNVHASLLPKYRGAAPIQWAVIDGEEKSGVTIMQMDEGLDTGDMIAKVEVPLTAEETGESLFDRLAEAGAQLLVDTLIEVQNGNIHAEKQPEESPTPYARMITKEDGRIDWSKRAVEIERLVRGMNSWPCAFTSLHKKGVKIWKSYVLSEEEAENFADSNAGRTDNAAGTVIGTGKEGICVQTGDGILCITELQLEGKKRMNTGDFLRGHSVETGTKLGE